MINQQIETITEHKDALQIVRSLPVQDALIMIKHYGFSDSLELVSLLSPEQVQGIIDLDGWHGYELAPGKLGSWLEAMMMADKRQALKQFLALDIELISLLFKLCTDIYDLSAEEEPNEIPLMQITTPDYKYMVAFKDGEEYEGIAKFLHFAIQHLYGRDVPLISRIIESVRWENASYLEEEALRWKSARLLDLGFSTPEDAKAILCYVDPEQLSTREGFENPSLKETSHLLVKNSSTSSVFSKALENLNVEEKTRVMLELTMVTNRVQQAKDGDFGDIKELSDTSEYVINRIEIGLVYLSKGTVDRLDYYLLKHPLQAIFQVGHSLILQPGVSWKKLARKSELGLSVNACKRLDYPLRETLVGVLQKDPVYFSALTEPEKVTYRPFKTVDDLAVITRALSEAAFRCALLGPNGLNIPDELEEPTGGVLLATWLLHQLIGNGAKLEPFSNADITKFFARLEQHPSGAKISLDDRNLLLELVSQLPEKEETKMRAKNFANIVLGTVESEFSRITDSHPDPKFISTIWTTKHTRL